MVLIDGKKIKFIKNKIKKVKFIIKGDEKTISIGAISIITKYLRDIYMIKISKQINNYFLDKNKGYCSKEHIKQLKIYGPSKIHRLSFIKNFYKP
jgi:ribonuclease HII